MSSLSIFYVVSSLLAACRTSKPASLNAGICISFQDPVGLTGSPGHQKVSGRVAAGRGTITNCTHPAIIVIMTVLVARAAALLKPELARLGVTRGQMGLFSSSWERDGCEGEPQAAVGHGVPVTRMGRCGLVDTLARSAELR